MLEKDIVSAWYLIQTFPGKESLAIDFIKKNAEEIGCIEDIEEFFVPEQNKNNSKITDDKMLQSVMMGYFALKMRLTPSIRKMVDKIQASKFTLNKQKRREDGTLIKSRSNINHRITFFIEKKMTESDLRKMIDSSELYHDIKHVFRVGDGIIVVEGPLKNLCGIVTKVHSKDKISADVEIVGRKVSIEFDISKVKKEE
jgi:transcription antitermination factor NusG